MNEADKRYGGRYVVIERAGTGGMAEVYRAHDELLDREVAVKVLNERLSRDRSFVERFRREAQSAANLNHPNIVSLYDYGSEGDTYFIVMEFIDGRPLAEIVKQEGPLLPERAAEIASDIAKALDRAHTAGLVHRDIKSSNIMVSDGHTKVTDFGIARALSGDGDQTMTQTGMVIGTASYLSPEQAQGNPIDARSDIYSLGVVLYEMLTGETPFAGETPLAVAYKHVREDARPPSSLNANVPTALDAIVLKAMAKNPDNRYSSAAEMNADLQRFLSGQKVQATPVLGGDTMVAPVTERTELLAEEAYEPEPRRAGWYVLAALLVLGAFALVGWWLADNIFAEDVTVPRLVGLQEDEAREELESLGLNADIERDPSRRPIGRVFDQDPDAGDTLQEGDSVTLFVSTGPRQSGVPSVVGQTVEEATETLEDADLELGDVTEEPSEEVEEGTIISQAPEAGEQVARGTEVDVVVSSGVEVTTVPAVEGLPEEDAVAEIRAAGLVPEVIREASDDVDEGIVIAQEPPAESEAEAGDVVQITVSTGPEERSMPNVTGMDADDAEALLESDYGLDVSRVNETDEPCAEPPGTVCRQDPPPGTPVSPGDNATLFVQPGDASLPRLFA